MSPEQKIKWLESEIQRQSNIIDGLIRQAESERKDNLELRKKLNMPPPAWQQRDNEVRAQMRAAGWI